MKKTRENKSLPPGGERTEGQASIHGVLLEVSGVGILIIGPSGIGKSESALDLVTRGHRLVADDLILLQRSEEQIIGRGSDHAGAHMEIRGLGIINIRDLFGVTSVLEKKAIELVVDLRERTLLEEGDRLGLDDQYYELLGVRLPYLRIPVSPGRSMGIILEVAARNHLLKARGYHSARAFDRDLSRRLQRVRKREDAPEEEA